MRLILPLALALIMATPTFAVECRPLANRYEMLEQTTVGLISLVQARPIDWKALEVPAEKRKAYAALRAATDIMLPALRRYVDAGKSAVPAIADCKRYGEATPAGQAALVRSAVAASDQLVPLLVAYLVAYDAAKGVN